MVLVPLLPVKSNLKVEINSVILLTDTIQGYFPHAFVKSSPLSVMLNLSLEASSPTMTKSPNFFILKNKKTHRFKKTLHHDNFSYLLPAPEPEVVAQICHERALEVLLDGQRVLERFIILFYF